LLSDEPNNALFHDEIETMINQFHGAGPFNGHPIIEEPDEVSFIDDEGHSTNIMISFVSVSTKSV
jgi:hypothetical protein